MQHNREARGRRLGWVAMLGLLHGLLHGAAIAAGPPPTPVIVSRVAELPFEDRIEALGTLRANESITLTASVTETVSGLHFDDGDRVAAAQVLAEMTSAEEQALLKEARALVDEAQRQYRRVQSLAKQGTAAASLLDQRRREWQTARARVVAIESRLSDRLIKAPFDGVVGLRNISLGALVEPGDVITTLDDDSVMKLDLSVPAVYLAGLRSGLGLVATTRAFGRREFSGEVHSIDSRVDPITRSVIVRVLLPNADRLLKPGMLMQVSLRKDPRRTLMIPEAALLSKGRGHSVLVAMPDGDLHRVETRPVQIGARRPGEVEILDGLIEGELVITHGTLRVRPGQAIEVRAIDNGERPLRELLGSTAPAPMTGSTE